MAAQWKLAGDYFEACNCQSTCPCIFLADPDEGDCQLALAWHVREGYFEGTRLDGLNVAATIHTPGNMVTGPKWQAAFYLDERTTPEQAQALARIFTGEVGGFWANIAPLVGEHFGFQNAQIRFEADGKRRSISIPQTLDLEVEATKGAGPEKEARVTNPALYAAPGFDPVISRSTRYSYRGHGFEWDNAGKNAFYSDFEYSG